MVDMCLWAMSGRGHSQVEVEQIVLVVVQEAEDRKGKKLQYKSKGTTTNGQNQVKAHTRRIGRQGKDETWIRSGS